MNTSHIKQHGACLTNFPNKIADESVTVREDRQKRRYMRSWFLMPI